MNKVVIVTIEGLGTNLVGCYGGSIGPTKNWDHFAAHAIVFDQFWADALRPVDVLESMLLGEHFANRSSRYAPETSEAVSTLFARALLVTDSLNVIEQMSCDFFGDTLLVESQSDDPRTDDADSGDDDDQWGGDEAWDEHRESDDESANDPSNQETSTQITRLFEAALGRWASVLEEYPILWIHSQGLNGRWDAPYEYRSIMCDEGDPDPPVDTTRAQLKLAPDTDPDLVFGMACAAGGQAIAMDDAWGMIEEILEQLGIAEECLQVLAGVSGYPMGEHGWVGYSPQSLHAETLHAESLHLPLIVKPANRLELGVRVPFMVQPHSLRKTVSAWLSSDDSPSDSFSDSIGSGIDLVTQTDALPADQWPLGNQLACSCFENQFHMAVAAWSCRWSDAANGGERVELFAMPDDRWQQNEVSQRAVAIVGMLTEQRDKWLASIDTNSNTDMEPLPSDLTHPMR
jgi:hypothetical protein